MQHDKRRLLQPASQSSTLIPLRGPSGDLYAILDREKKTIQIKPKNKPAETFDLRQYFAEPPPADA
jgi:hypothetical protein